MHWRAGLKPLDGLLSRAGRLLVDSIYPLECVGCASAGKVICNRCAAELAVLKPPYCNICAAPGAIGLCQRCTDLRRSFDGIRAPYHHAGAVRRAIHAFKYEGIRAAAPQLGRMMADYWALDPVPVDIMAPVPMHARRFRERGYNQAGLLAREVAGRIGLKLEANLLERLNHVSPQAQTASGSERMLNVAGSVAISTEVDLAGMRVLLVDDVATTGSTLDACAAVLKDAGASEVWGLVLAVAGGQ